jgi:DNA-3-methyladenine glycosylase
MRLGEAFFARDVLAVAPELVGKMVCRQIPYGPLLQLRITQTEAYRGEEDKACHARFGKTPRSKILYQKGGFAYVYLVYGLHWLMNAVTGAEDEPQAVLLRAMESPYDGPGKSTAALQITGSENGIWLPESHALWLEDDGFRPALVEKPRVGISYAPPEWRDIPWRWIDKSKE